MVVQMMARALILILWFYSSCGTLGFLVQRHVQGDVFQNLGLGTGFCTQRNAVCSVLQLNGECEDSRTTSEEATCPSCACQNGMRYNAELDFCEEGTCPGYAGHEFFNQINQIRTMQQVLVVLVNLTFPCPGTVRAWRYTLLTPRENTFFYLQVWRFVGAADSGEIVRVGSSRVDVAASSSSVGSTESIHYLDANEQFPVEVGDFLGVFTLLATQDIPIPSRRFSDTSGRFGTEAYVFRVTNGVLPTSLTLSERFSYENNVGVNLHGVTGHVNGEIDCFSILTVVQTTAVHHPALTTQSTNVGNTKSVHDVLHTSTAGNSISINQATQDGPTPTRTVSGQSWIATTTVETPYLGPTFTTVDSSGSAGNRHSDGGNSQSGYLNPVTISLISASGVILLIVSTILVIVFLLWRRKSMGAKSRKPTREEKADSNSSPNSPAHPHEERADSNSTYYHVLTDGHPRSLSQQSLNSSKTSTTTLNIHIHYDLDQRLHRSNSNSEQVFHIVVPTKAERELCHETRYSNGGPRSDEECILSQSNRQSLDDYFQETHQYWVPANNEDELYYQLAQNKYREILRKYISVGKVLGSGHFGSVQKATWQTHVGPVEVAVKTLKSGLSEGEKVKFLQEAAIMGQFSHPNIIKLHGVVTVGEPVLIVLEMMTNGDLRNHLITLRDSLGKPSSRDYPNMFLQFSRHIAAGMCYLSNKGFIHRDLAARNILLNENMDCKIGDFGMARDLLEDSYYYMNGGPIPVKWTSPEALNSRKFTAASDVWSYGVVLYEVWSLGTKPFEFINNLEVIALVNEGHRLPPPPGCSKEMYKLMLDCWHPDPSKRPTFRDITELLSVEDEHLLTWQEAWHISSEYHEAPRSNQTPNQANLTLSEDTQYASIQNQLMV